MFAAATAVALALGAGVAWTAESGSPQACEVAFTPRTVAVSAEPVPVRVSMSEDIGEIQRVQAHEDSGIAPGEFNQEMGSLMLDLSEAQSGEWAIWFHGNDDASCEGSLTVTAEGARR